MGINLRHDAGKSDNIVEKWMCSVPTLEPILHSQLFTMRGCIVLCTQDNIIVDMIGLINLKNNYASSRACHNLPQESLLLHMLYLGAI